MCSDSGYSRFGNSYIKIEEDLHIFLVKLTKEAVICLQAGKLCMCKVKGNQKLLSSKLHQVLATENGVSSQEPGLLTINCNV